MLKIISVALFATLLRAEVISDESIVTQKLLIPSDETEYVFNDSRATRGARRSEDEGPSHSLDDSYASDGDFPWAARLQISRQFDGFICTGALVSNRFVISLRSCVEK